MALTTQELSDLLSAYDNGTFDWDILFARDKQNYPELYEG
jgi:hypothetical protein